MQGFAKSKSYWYSFGWGLLVGLLSAIGTLVFMTIMDRGIALVWPVTPGWEPLSGSWRIVVIMTVAGLVVGLIHRFLPAEEIMFAGAVVKGRLDPRPVPGALVVSLVSMIGGFSVGPEVPAGMLGGGLGTWLSDRAKLSEELRRTNVLSGVMGAYGGLFTAPFAVLLMPLELAHRHRPRYYGTLVTAGAAAVLGFALFFASTGEQYSSLLRFLDLPSFTLEIWHLGMAIVLGVLGAVLLLIFGLLQRALKGLVAPLKDQPIVRCTLAGLLLGLLGMALPLTMFLGSEGLVTVTTDAAAIGVALLVVYVFAKMLALAGALAAGFIGGPIFPLFFIGGTAGTAINLVFPEIPMALSVSCMMAAMAGALLPVPISMGVLTILIAGVPQTEAIPVIMAALVAYFVTHGMGIIPSPTESPEGQEDSQPGEAGEAGQQPEAG
jgi:H+/Cl- antiporter ClcA